MGKKNKKKGNKSINNLNLPNVSICTPTFNRRPFFEGLIQCIKEQDYPHDKIEWVIIDDGTDKIEDIIKSDTTKELLGDIKIRYFYYETQMDLGKKRNIMHEKCSFKNESDIILYMDDDDFYPSERVSHSVKKLTSDPKILCGGSSEIYLWFNALNKMYKFGPYGPNHATAGTFAFKRKLLNDTSYQDDAVLAEEKHFLKNYTVPFVQFDTLKTILVVSHEQNTFDKKTLLSNQNQFVKESSLNVKHFISNDVLKYFYETKINKLLIDYTPGDVKNKPKVLEEISRRVKENHTRLVQNADSKMSGVFATDSLNQARRELSIGECKKYMSVKTDECLALRQEINRLKIENNQLREKNK
tara:strand:+ start:138 stop:1208 length:1071 start_codon:yes stop_codon:yes gene_type:complete